MCRYGWDCGRALLKGMLSLPGSGGSRSAAKWDPLRRAREMAGRGDVLAIPVSTGAAGVVTGASSTGGGVGGNEAGREASAGGASRMGAAAGSMLRRLRPRALGGSVAAREAGSDDDAG